MKKPRRVMLTLPKGLTWSSAYKAASKKCPKGFDFRGLTYNPKTGRAVLI